VKAESVEGSEKPLVRDQQVAESAEPVEESVQPVVRQQMEYLTDTDGFSLTQVSFGTILAPIGVGLMVFGFCAYFDFIPGGDISPLLLVYGFPLSLLGFALKYAELKPVTCKTTQEAFDLRETQMTDIQKQVREDTTRFRYGDEQHLDEALGRIFRFGRLGEIPRRLAPVLTGLREETRTLEGVEGPQYTLILEFDAEIKEEQWSSKIPKFQSFFGPGIVAKLIMRDNGADIELICDGTGSGKTGIERKDVLPPLLPGLAPRKQD